MEEYQGTSGGLVDELSVTSVCGGTNDLWNVHYIALYLWTIKQRPLRHLSDVWHWRIKGGPRRSMHISARRMFTGNQTKGLTLCTATDGREIAPALNNEKSQRNPELQAA